MTTAAKTYRAAIVGCSRIGAFIDNEVMGRSDMVLPYSHAAGYEACERTDLIAGADLREEVLEAFGGRYDVPASHRYTDYRQMIEREKPDIVSVATQPEQRAEVALFAVEHGVRALYCEKPLCASLEEADRLVAAVEKHGVAFNMGTNRRWHPAYEVMRNTIASGELGALQALIVYSGGTLFNTTSHYFDLIQWLNGDNPVAWVQGWLPKGEASLDGDVVIEDPAAEGMVGFSNGVIAHILRTSLPSEHQAVFERGSLTAMNNGSELALRRMEGEGRTRKVAAAPAPAFTLASSTLRLIEDLVHALDTGEATRGGVRVARENMHMIFGMIESGRRGGVQMKLPLEDCRLVFKRRNVRPGQPRYAPVES
ncbi:MAG TPA: Gfo/Idh/MocA family oxidoreductase [Chloroflexota bacterium]|nr:Gfo/Idh/MocA family oxidoreductase [Chloroflexota bacterium]